MNKTAMPAIRLTRAGDRLIPSLHTPDKILPQVKDAKSLRSALDWYSHPFLKLRTPDNKYARRRFVEMTRPALKWFCDKFEVPVPRWLADDHHYDSMDEKTFNNYFGPEPLKPVEFKPISAHVPQESQPTPDKAPKG